jgi:hypothetical protein
MLEINFISISIRIYREIILRFCLPLISDLYFTVIPFGTHLELKLAFKGLFSLRWLFFYDSWRSYLVYSRLAICLGVETFTDWDDNSLSFRSDKLVLIKFKSSSHVFGSFLGKQLDNDFNVVFIGLIFKSDLLIKYEFIWGGCWNLISDWISSVL